MSTCKWEFVDGARWCKTHGQWESYESSSLCIDGAIEERDAAIAKRDALAAQLAEERERACTAESQLEELTSRTLNMYNNNSKLIKGCRKLLGERATLVAQLAEARERAQLLEDTLRTLLRDYAAAARQGSYTDGILDRAQAVLYSLGDGDALVNEAAGQAADMDALVESNLLLQEGVQTLEESLRHVLAGNDGSGGHCQYHVSGGCHHTKRNSSMTTRAVMVCSGGVYHFHSTGCSDETRCGLCRQVLPATTTETPPVAEEHVEEHPGLYVCPDAKTCPRDCAAKNRHHWIPACSDTTLRCGNAMGRPCVRVQDGEEHPGLYICLVTCAGTCWTETPHPWHPNCEYYFHIYGRKPCLPQDGEE